MVEDGVGEADDLTIAIGDYGALIRAGRGQARRPDPQAICDDVAIEV
jgi:hypothetical protein